MFRSFINLLVLAGLGVILAACSQKTPPAPEQPKPVYVGKIDKVFPEMKYVLIELYSSMYESGTVLISQSPDGVTPRRVANLCVSPERMGSTRIPADIRAGSVGKGDLVFLYRNMAAPTAQSTPAATDTTKTDDKKAADDDTPPFPVETPAADGTKSPTADPNSTPVPAPPTEVDEATKKQLESVPSHIEDDRKL